MGSNRDFGVVVLSYGDGPARRCVDGFIGSGVDPESILVVHNPSRPDELPPPLPPGVATRVMHMNLGYGRAMNEGMRHWRRAGCSSALLCTHDVEMTTRTAVELIEVVRGNSTIAACGPVLRRPDGSPLSAGGYISRCGDVAHRAPDGSRMVDVDWLDGSAVAIDLALEVEFIEDFFLYWEDVALGIDIRAAGYRLVCLEEASAVSQPGNSGSRAALFTYLLWRNRLGFAVRRRSHAMLICTIAKLLAAMVLRLARDDLAWSRRRVAHVYVRALAHGLTLKLGRPSAVMLRGSDAR
jgi:GT2 family glycosyltransferase